MGSIFLFYSVEMASSAKIDDIYCATCKNQKPSTAFNYDQKTQGYYADCKSCFKAANVAFWTGKNFKFCRECKIDKPIRKFTCIDGVPHMRCTKCYESGIARKKADERAAEKER